MTLRTNLCTLKGSGDEEKATLRKKSTEAPCKGCGIPKALLWLVLPSFTNVKEGRRMMKASYMHYIPAAKHNIPLKAKIKIKSSG